MKSRTCPHESRRSCRGLTLIEILVATVLSVWMMSSVVGVIRRLEQQSRVLIPPSHSFWLRNLSDQLRWDLTNARTMIVRSDGWTLYGYGGRNWDTGESHLRPTEVSYSIEQRGDTPILLREELELNRLDNPSSHRELAAVGLKSLWLGRMEDSAEAISKQTLPSRPGSYVPVPTRVRIVGLDTAGRIVLDSIIFQAGS